MPTTAEQGDIARRVIDEMQPLFDADIVTTIEEPTHFTIAEAYHHDYYARNPAQGYCMAVVGPKINKVRAKHAHLYTA
jgi:peptide-methionine (S)-S-oxide reductase